MLKNVLQHWKYILLILLAVASFGLYMNEQNIVQEERGKIAELKKEIEGKEFVIRQKTQEMEEYKELYDSTTTENNDQWANLEEMTESVEKMVKVINNWTKLVEAINTYIKKANMYWEDDYSTTRAWKNIENLAECYNKNVKDLKNNWSISECY